MDRRRFLQAGLGAALGARAIGEAVHAQAGAPAAAPAAQAPPAARPAAPRKLIIDAYSRHLHWVRSADEVADAAFDMACEGVMPTVRPYPGHILPERVAQDLPPFVNTLRRRGLKVVQIRGPEITDVSQPHAEAIIRTASELGITHYWFGTDRYDLAKPLPPQLDALKLRVEKFVKLNEKYRTTLMYHTRANADAIGGTVWDLLSVMKNFDPKHVGFHWDTGHMALHAGGTWEVLMRAAGPYIAGIGWKDRVWRQELPFKGQGGAFPGADVIAAARGTAAAARGAGPAQAARGAPPAGARGGEEGASPGRPLPLPLHGTNGRGNGWSAPIVPLGTGIIDIPKIALVLRDIGFNGPMELQAEYPNGGAEDAADKITLPRQRVLGAMKRDVLLLRSAFMLAPESGLRV